MSTRTSTVVAATSPPSDGRCAADQPLVLAHRGSPAPGQADNGVTAVAAALAGGADGAEVDVRLSADGRLICSHDPAVPGRGGAPLPIATSTADALRRARLAGGHRVALLDELLGTAARYGRRRIVVEAKACGERRGEQRTAAALAEVLAGFTGSLDLTVSSFDPVLLAAIRSALADLDIGTALLGSPFTPAADLLRHAVLDGHDEIHPSVYSLLRAPGVAEAARSLGVAVTCWTVNSARQVARLAALGVDALITDDPARVRAALGCRAGTRPEATA